MVEIEKPRITCLDAPENPSYGKYVVEPLERGYGMTLGNSLRRILLSSLPGYAATSVKIQGVHHPRCYRGCDGDRPERQADHPEAALRRRQNCAYRRGRPL